MTRRAPAPLRAGVALALSALSLWCAWGALRAGASRVVSDYAARSGQPAAADASVSLAPADPEAHYARANLAADAGDHAAAARAYEEALRLRPRDYVIWVELGKAREELGDAEGALEAFRRAVGLAPFYARPRWQLGNALMRVGRTAEAFAELRRAAESDPALYPNLLGAAWHTTGKEAGAFVRAAAPRTAGETLAVVRFLVKAGAAGEGLRVLRESGAAVSEDARRALVADLIAAEEFRGAYEARPGGRDAAAWGLADGGFEGEVRADDDAFGWQFARADRALRFSLDADSPREGARSLKVEYAGGSNPSSPAVSRLLVLEPGVRYRLTFSARAKELVTGGPPFVEVVSAAKSGGSLAATPPLADATSDWQDLGLEFTAPPEGAVRVVLKRRPCASSPCPAFGGLWLDSFGLRRLDRTS